MTDSFERAAISLAEEFDVRLPSRARGVAILAIVAVALTAAPAFALVDDPLVEAARRDRHAGMIRLAAGELDQAEMHLTMAVRTLAGLEERDPAYEWESGQAKIDLGHVYWHSRRPKKAIELWSPTFASQQKLLRSAERDEARQRELAESLAGVAERYAELVLWEEAVDHYQQAFETYAILPISVKYRAALAACALGDRELYRKWARDMFARFGNSNVADERQLFIAALVLDPDSGIDPMRIATLAESLSDPRGIPRRILPVAAYAAINAGRFAEAESMGKAIGSARGLGVMAIVEMQKGNKDRAQYWLGRMRETLEDECRRLLLLPLRPLGAGWTDLAEIHVLFARAQRTVGGDDAIKDPWLLLMQARSRAHAGLVARAERDFDGALAQETRDPLLLTARGQICLETGRLDRAHHDFRLAQQMMPNDPWPSLQQAHGYLARGAIDKAEKAFEAAAAVAPKHLDLFLESGWWIAGPYPGEMAKAFPPETATDVSQPLDPVEAPDAFGRPRAVSWRRALPTGGAPTFFEFGSVDLRESSSSQQPGATYAMAFVYSPDDRDTFLKFGSAGPRRLWLNGELVNESNEPFTMWPRLDRVQIRLRKGLNRFVVKTADSPAFFARLEDAYADDSGRLYGTPLFEEAAAAYEGAMTRPYGSYDWGMAFRAAVARAAAGDWEGYRRWRDARWPDLEAGRDPAGAWWIGHLFALSPTDLPPDPVKWIESLQWGLTTPEIDPGFAHAILALAILRTGDTVDSLKVASARAAANYPITWSVLAMIHHKSGNDAEARRFLERSNRWWADAVDKSLTGPQMAIPLPQQVWPSFFVVHRGAQAMVLGAEPPQDPLWLLLSARIRVRRGLQDRAARDFDEAVTVRPDDASVWMRRARLFAEARMMDRITGDLDKAAELVKTPAERQTLARAAARCFQAAHNTQNFELRRACALRAVAALRSVVESGTDRRTLASDPELQPLAGVPEFQALLK